MASGLRAGAIIQVEGNIISSMKQYSCQLGKIMVQANQARIAVPEWGTQEQLRMGRRERRRNGAARVGRGKCRRA
jgi:hypothetical protein